MNPFDFVPGGVWAFVAMLAVAAVLAVLNLIFGDR